MTTPYTAGTGVPGPGEFHGGPVDWSQTSIDRNDYGSFGCNVVDGQDIQTPDWKPAQAYFERKVFTNGLRTFPDGKTVKYWGFEDKIFAPDQQPIPSPLIRLQEGTLAHVLLETRTGPHTIHHHGIEPTTMNDGVGHVSFETSGSYVYQWKPRHAGTWFYHCHVNTVLHFEMGLFGLLVVDPPEGWGTPYKGGAAHSYNVEKFWVVDDMDPRWHDLNHGAGLCGDDVGLNIFRPKYFLVNGVDKSQTKTDNKVVVKAVKGDKILIRLLNAAYSVLGVKIDNIPAELIAIDGHALAAPERPWSSAKTIGASTEFHVASAMRHDLWIDTTPLAPGSYKVTFNHYDWVTKQVHNPGSSMYQGTSETFIVISSPST